MERFRGVAAISSGQCIESADHRDDAQRPLVEQDKISVDDPIVLAAWRRTETAVLCADKGLSVLAAVADTRGSGLRRCLLRGDYDLFARAVFSGMCRRAAGVLTRDVVRSASRHAPALALRQCGSGGDHGKGCGGAKGRQEVMFHFCCPALWRKRQSLRGDTLHEPGSVGGKRQRPYLMAAAYMVRRPALRSALSRLQGLRPWLRRPWRGLRPG